MGATKTARASKSGAAAAPTLPSKTFIIDNGAYTMKAGYAPPSGGDTAVDQLRNCLAVPNALVKTRHKQVYTGLQLNTQVSDWNEAAFRRPVEKGYIVNWEAQREIWEHTFFDEKTARKPEVRCPDPTETTLILTEAPNAMAALQKNADEIIMEEWGFGGYARYIGPALNAWNDVHSLFGDAAIQGSGCPAGPAECLLVVDSGYSHTTVTPVYNGRPLQRGVRRLDVGGKYLTNYLKDLVSIRQYNILDETYIVNEVKEAACYVSDNFSRDLERTWKGNKNRQAETEEESVVVDYVLPNPNTRKKGFMRPHESAQSARQKLGMITGPAASETEDVLVLGNERFTVPEILFNPEDIGMQQPGIPEMVMQSLSVLPTGLHPSLLANVLVVGGNALIPGLMGRLGRDLRQIAPAECVVRVRRPDEYWVNNSPISATWLGASRLARNGDALKEIAITSQQYQEYGSAWLARKFAPG